ncbi:MAG TPA: AMP-binding protein, partial [Deltaproteobacteria bacterium]|nr:AMP-binding protein [Deltaproteobacteria bacterium]
MARHAPSGRKIPTDHLEKMEGRTLPQILAMQAELFGREHIAIREKAYGIWQAHTWEDYLRYARYTGLGLKALGLTRHDHVAMIVNNHPEWLFTQLGAQAFGAVTLNLFTSAVAPELAGALARIQAGFVIVQDQEQVDKLLEQTANLPHLKAIIYIDPTGMRGYAGNRLLMSFKDLLELGKIHEARHPGLFLDELAKGKADETAHMIMTSGTTGVSKLAMLSHRNYAAMGRKWIASAPVTIGANWLSMTPPAW